MKQLHVDTSIVIFTNTIPAQVENPDIRYIIVPEFSPSRFRLINILTREHLVIRNLWDVISRMNADEILYLRFSYPFFSWWYYLHKKRNCRIVFEHESFENQEYIKRGNYLYPLFDYIFGGSIRSHCDGIVGVTEEITDYQVKRSGDPQKPHLTLGNGIDVNAVPVKASFSFSDSQVHLLCVANVMKWHGIDRLIRGMKEFKGPEKIYLHVVGMGEELPAIKRMVENFAMNDAVRFYGPLHGKDLDDVFNRCDIAVGSLGIHRIGLHEAATLKAREYCARGIPFIYGISDVDFPSDFPYILPIPADETPVNMAEVIRFARRVYSDQSFPGKMREYAKESLDWSFKTMKLKKFLESLV